MQKGLEYTCASFETALMQEDSYTVLPSETWSDDAWFADQDKRNFRANAGYLCLSEGEASGQIVGGNITTLRLLQGTPFMPQLDGRILFLEDFRALEEFDRNLESLLQSPGGQGILGIVIGRFPPSAQASPARLCELLKSRPLLQRIPVVYGLDMGHTTPHTTIPIGGTARIKASHDCVTIEITRH